MIIFGASTRILIPALPVDLPSLRFALKRI